MSPSTVCPSTGFVHPDRIYKNYGCQPGDVLILTKQIGSGVINTAVKAEMASDSARCGSGAGHVFSEPEGKEGI